MAKHEYGEAIHGLKELIGFIAIMASDNVPGREHKLCSEVKYEGKWTDFEKIIRALQNPETDMSYVDGHFLFNN